MVDQQKEKISESKDFYQRLKSHSKQMFDEYRRLLDDLVNTNYPHEIENENYAHALLLTGTMFRHTKQSCCMLTGPEGNDFLKELDEEFGEALQRLKRNNGQFRLVLLDSRNTDYLSEKEEKYPEVLKIEKASLLEGEAMEHFIVCDSQMVRLEEPHGELGPDDPADQVHAKVYFNDKPRAKTTKESFDGIWNHLRRADN